MITTALLYLIYGAIWPMTQVAILLLPDVSLYSGIGSTIATASGYMANLNNLFPVNILVIILGLIISIEIFIAGYKTFMWVLHRIPGE